LNKEKGERQNVGDNNYGTKIDTSEIQKEYCQVFAEIHDYKMVWYIRILDLLGTYL
jgi:hypothetical protein